MSCIDISGNSNIGEINTFQIDTEREFSITLNKNSYNMGEGGIYIITAPSNSDITLILTNSKSETVTRVYSGPYPIIDDIIPTDYPGGYSIQGFVNYNGAVKEILVNFDVINTLKKMISNILSMYFGLMPCPLSEI